MKSDRIAYRPDIDGLRAIAVMSVVAFHAFPLWMPGGFVGVDVFFVISGYLITQIILREQSAGGFRSREFYIRRITRIVPALLLVLGPSSVIAWCCLFPLEQTALGKHLAGASGFLSNFVLWGERGYFDRPGETKPLLHLWSLGIEEQFYLVWPPVLLLLRRSRRKGLFLALATLLSFSLNLAFVRDKPFATFFLPVTRGWELSVGALVAQLEMSAGDAWKSSIRPDRSRVFMPLSLCGLTALTLALACIRSSSVFPGWWALLPTIGTAAIITAGSTDPVNRTLLGHSAMRTIGKISYPLYLWHWPLLAFAHVFVGHAVPIVLRLTLVAGSVALAYLTWRFVEQPIRARRTGRTAAALLAGMAIVGASGLALWLVPPHYDRFDPRVAALLKASKDWEFPGSTLRPIKFAGYSAFLAESNVRQTVLFIGDSNMQQYRPRIEYLIRTQPQRWKSAVFSTRGGCVPIPGVRDDRTPQCAGYDDEIMAMAALPNVDTVVVAACWWAYFHPTSDLFDGHRYYIDRPDGRHYLDQTDGQEMALESLETLTRQLAQKNKRVVIVLNQPANDRMDPLRAIRRYPLASRSIVDPTAGMSRAAFIADHGAIRDAQIAMAARNGFEVVDPLDSLCDGDHCPVTTREGLPIYLDAGHLRVGYVVDHIHYLDQIMAISP